MYFSRPLAGFFALSALACSAPVLAHPGGPGWNGPGWGDPDWGPMESDRRSHAGSAAEGKVVVNRFMAEGAAAAVLGHGRIAVSATPESEQPADPGELATLEAAVIDQLAHAGYDTATPDPTAGQLAEVRVMHAMIQPQEAPHKPVSGAMSVGVGNHGSMMGMELNIDMTKPRAALISTRLEVRIRDRASNAVLWEGRADIATRAGDPDWGGQAVATRLAQALFAGFPGHSGETVTSR